MSGPKIAVAGAGGRVGRLLLPALRAGGNRAAAQSSGNMPGATLLDPLADRGGAFTRWLAGESPDLVVLLWGVTAASPNRQMQLNRDLAVIGYDAARRAGVPRVVAMSSAAVYAPERGHRPFLEDDADGLGLGAYGAAKLKMEAALLDAHRATGSGVQLTILRLANVVGADALAGSIRSASAENPLRLDRFPDGRTPMRSYLSPVTLAAILTELAASNMSAPEILNAADSESPIEMAAVLDAFARTGRPIPWVGQAAPPGAIEKLAIDSSRLRRLCPVAARSFRQSADAMVADWLGLDACS